MRTVAFLLHTSSPDQISGGERSLVELAAAAARDGIACLVIAPRRGRSTELARAAGLEVIVRRCRMLWLSHPAPSRWPASLLRAAAFLLWSPSAWRIGRLLRARRVDLVHVNGIVHVWGAVAGRAAGIPVVWHLREIVGGPLRRRLLISIARLLADRIVAVSGAVAEQFGDRGEKVRVIYNGIPAGNAGGGASGAGGEPARTDPAAAGRVRIGHAGQILPHKGQEEFLRIARRLVAGGHPVEFAIAGAGPRGGGVEKLRRRARELGLGDRVECPGYLQEIRPFLSSVDVLAVTSTAPDPLPRVVAEAMMEGVPTVAFATGGIPEMVRSGETGFLVPPGDLERFAAALERLVRSPGLRRRMGAAARSRAVELYSMGSYIRHCVGVYDEVLTPCRRPAERTA